ncbi:hypothetical protein ACO0LM_00665 [Undibacterium sp. Di26W]|uniref:hypothetical protein n=1 Tax=Undibacterium sp. Di26W TaxID=3413035 RepID=UPI003BEF8AF2
MQLELFPFESLTVSEKQHIYEIISRHYWFIRNCRKTAIHDAKRRRFYRLIEAQKKRLLLAGVSKREILDYLACCRLTCGRKKQCPFCKGEYRPIYQRLQHLLLPNEQKNNEHNFA